MAGCVAGVEFELQIPFSCGRGGGGRGSEEESKQSSIAQRTDEMECCIAQRVESGVYVEGVWWIEEEGGNGGNVGACDGRVE